MTDREESFKVVLLGSPAAVFEPTLIEAHAAFICGCGRGRIVHVEAGADEPDPDTLCWATSPYPECGRRYELAPHVASSPNIVD